MSGSTIWYVQRLSALVNLIYVLWVGSFFLNEITFENWSLFSSTFLFKASTSLVIISIITHSSIGLWTVGTDYLTPRTLGFVSSIFVNYADSLRLMYQLLFITLSLTFTLTTLCMIWWL
tara:strand:+ start:786 stop:1142 length:357 start_codon:yes stop_codon:yes gene_type:complete